MLFLFAIAFTAHAQTVRVTKVAGKKAVVVRESGPALQVGQLLTGGGELNENDLDSAVGSSSTSMGGKSVGSRDHTISGSAQFSSTSSESSTPNSKKVTSSQLTLSAGYGWNKKIFEYGPRFSITRNSPGNNTTNTSFGLGGFFDYNFMPNVPGADMVYFAGASLDYRRSSSDAAGSSDSDGIDLFVGPGLKWFPLGNSLAIRAEGGLGYSRGSIGNTTSTGITFAARAGFQMYF